MWYPPVVVALLPQTNKITEYLMFFMDIGLSSFGVWLLPDGCFLTEFGDYERMGNIYKGEYQTSIATVTNLLLNWVTSGI